MKKEYEAPMAEIIEMDVEEDMMNSVTGSTGVIKFPTNSNNEGGSFRDNF